MAGLQVVVGPNLEFVTIPLEVNMDKDWQQIEEGLQESQATALLDWDKDL